MKTIFQILALLGTSPLLGASFEALLNDGLARIEVRDNQKHGAVHSIAEALIKIKSNPTQLKLGALYTHATSETSVEIQEEGNSPTRRLRFIWNLPTKEGVGQYRFFSTFEKRVPRANINLAHDAAQNLYSLLKQAGYKEISETVGNTTDTSVRNSDGTLTCTKSFIDGSSGPSYHCDLAFSLTH